jgi:hypothetical protein
MPSLAHWGWALVFVFDGGDGFPLAHGRRRPGEQVRARAEVYLAEHYFVVAVESELHHQPPRPDAAPFLLRHEREALPVAQPPAMLQEHGPRAGLRVPAPFPHRARLALALAGLGPYGGEEVPRPVAVARHGGGEPVRELGGVRGVDVGVVDERARRLGAGDARTEVRLEQLVLGRVGEESRERARRRRLVGEARRRGYHSVSGFRSRETRTSPICCGVSAARARVVYTRARSTPNSRQNNRIRTPIRRSISFSQEKLTFSRSFETRTGS